MTSSKSPLSVQDIHNIYSMDKGKLANLGKPKPKPKTVPAPVKVSEKSAVKPATKSLPSAD